MHSLGFENAHNRQVYWERESETLLAGLTFENKLVEGIVTSRPPDEIRDMDSEPFGDPETWAEQHLSLFKAWDQRIEVQRWRHKRLFTWKSAHRGLDVAFSVWVDEPITRTEINRWRTN